MKQFLLKSSNQRISLYDRPVCRLADGKVYSYIENSDCYVKVYDFSQVDLKLSKKLATMIEQRPSFSHKSEMNSSCLLWPSDMIFDDEGHYRGYSFDRIDLQDFIPLSLMIAPASVFDNNYKKRILTAYHFAALMSNLHQHAIYLINLDPARILINKHDLRPLIVDCDRLSIAGRNTIRYPANECNWLYCTPEAVKQSKPAYKLGMSQDNYAIAVLVFQLLNQGLHPYQAWPKPVYRASGRLKKLIENQVFVYQDDSPYARYRPLTWSMHDYFDEETKDLFCRAFSQGSECPSASEWQLHLKKYVSDNTDTLMQCKSDPGHFHFYKGCGECGLDTIKYPVIDRLLKTKNSLFWARINRVRKAVKMY